MKKVLLGLMLLGAVTYFGGGGTWASFSAETSNNGSSIASGTLTMSDTVNTGTACLSASGATSTANNVNPGCDKVFTLTNVAPGVFGGAAKIAIQNTGSIDASKLSFWASQVNATLSSALSGTVTALPLTALEGNVTVNDQLVVSYGSHSQTFVAGAAAVGGATSITVNSQAANFAYPIGASVTDTSSNTSVNNTDCFDAKTTTAAGGASYGTQLNFNPTTGNPLCGALLMYVQEQTGGFNYCWLGKGIGTAACTAPISVNLSTTLPLTATTTLPVTALNGNVASGDSIVVSSGSHTQTFTTTAAAFYGATSLTITSATPNFAYPPSSTVTDTTSMASLNSSGTQTITAFDTANSLSGKIFVAPLTGNGTIDSQAPVQLGRAGTSDTRTFIVGVYLPAPIGSNQNALQGLQSTFGITWHLDQ